MGVLSPPPENLVWRHFGLSLLGKGVALASSGQNPGRQLNIQQPTGHLHKKDHPTLTGVPSWVLKTYHPPATPPALSFSALYPPALPGNLEQNEALSRHALNAGSHAALLSAPLPKSLLLHRQALSALSASHRTVGSLCCDSLCWVPPSEPQGSLVRGPDRSSASHLPAASLCPEIIACIVSRLPS